jgi:hypothetical protein
MSVPRSAAALLTACLLAAAPSHAGEPAPAIPPADGVAAFLLRAGSDGKSFVSAGADEGALGEAARAWAARAEGRRAADLAAVATPGSSAEGRLVQALSKWTGEGRIAGPRAAAGFLEDAAEQARKLLAMPGVRQEVDAALAAVDQTGAVARAREFSGRRIRAGFGPERTPGALTGGGAQIQGAGGSVGGNTPGGVSNPAAGSVSKVSLVPADGVTPTGGVNPTAIPAGAYLPSANLPANFKKAGVVPPLAMIDLSASDRVINKALSVVNMEAYSRKDTLNRESAEGTQAAICRFLKQAKYKPSEAWSLSQAARNAPGADPGDLDLRNAEHYLYAYSSTSEPGGIGDSTGVQMLMAVGWTPFKTVTKHVRPTSTPSLEEAKWGVKGAWHGQHPPDWRATCGGK